MSTTFLGRHLYNQIVLPLVVASLAVGVVATALAVYFLSGLTETWTGQIADDSMVTIEQRLEQRAGQMTDITRFIADDERLHEAIARGDMPAAQGFLEKENEALRYDNVMLLDRKGTVLASSGMPSIAVGDDVLIDDASTYTNLSMAHLSFIRVGGLETMTALRPIITGEEDSGFTVAVTTVIDDAFINELVSGLSNAYAVYWDDFTPLASAVSPPEDASSELLAGLRLALDAPDPAVTRALRAAATGRATKNEIVLDGVRHTILASRFRLPGDPVLTSYAYVVSIVSQSVTQDASKTTTNLIAMWSIIAILALVGLGGWVARQVSDPLGRLTEGAQRIADGDFGIKIEVKSANEIGALADSFNKMTDSLRDRSESLTKKVLELATLYEMSRVLGSTLDLDDLLVGVLDSALRIFGADTGFVTMKDRSTGELELMAWRGHTAREHDEDAIRASMSEWVIREGRPLIFNPGSGDRPADGLAHSTTLAALCVPLVSSEGVVGALVVLSHDESYRFTGDDVRLLATIANHVTIAIGNIELFTTLQEAYLATVRSLAAAVDAKDPYTRGHSDRVAEYAAMIADRMGMSHDQQVALEMAAYLHDIGKIGVRESILLKEGKLDDEEMSQMRHHPLIGANILKPVGFPWPITPIVRHHHERWDGDGYPAGLKGEEIPLLARVLTVADAFEAMVADRPYRRGRSVEEGIEELQRCAGSQFDTTCVAALVEALAEHDKSVGDDGIDPEQIEIDEARAIFVAISEGMISSFKRLGGPRMASNVEREISEALEGAGLPYRVVSGRMVLGVHAEPNGDHPDSHAIDELRNALEIVDATLVRLSGPTLVEHFYHDAMSALSDRMRLMAAELELRVG